MSKIPLSESPLAQTHTPEFATPSELMAMSGEWESAEEKSLLTSLWPTRQDDCLAEATGTGAGTQVTHGN